MEATFANTIALAFYRFISQGTEHIPAERVKQIQWTFVFRKKEMNLPGLQLADLAAYPIARHVIKAEQSNPVFDIVKPKLYKGKGSVKRLKIFP